MLSWRRLLGRQSDTVKDLRARGLARAIIRSEFTSPVGTSFHFHLRRMKSSCGYGGDCRFAQSPTHAGIWPLWTVQVNFKSDSESVSICTTA